MKPLYNKIASGELWTLKNIPFRGNYICYSKLQTTFFTSQLLYTIQEVHAFLCDKNKTGCNIVARPSQTCKRGIGIPAFSKAICPG